MNRAYNIVDADGHVLEPLDLWTEYMDPGLRDRAPRLIADGFFPGAPAMMAEQLAGPPNETKRQIMAGGAKGFHGLE